MFPPMRWGLKLTTCALNLPSVFLWPEAAPDEPASIRWTMTDLRFPQDVHPLRSDAVPFKTDIPARSVIRFFSRQTSSMPLEHEMAKRDRKSTRLNSSH